jgi:hypothetical protein
LRNPVLRVLQRQSRCTPLDWCFSPQGDSSLGVNLTADENHRRPHLAATVCQRTAAFPAEGCP